MWNAGGRIWRRGATVVGTALALWALIAAAGWAGCLGWVAELFANYPGVPVLAAIAAVVLLARSVGRWAAGTAAVTLVVVIGLTLGPNPRMVPDAEAGASTLKFATWNAWMGRLDPEAAIRWIEATGPDVLTFTEITKPLSRTLRARLGTRYPFYLGGARNGGSGLAVFSRVPVGNWERSPKTAQVASFELEWPGGTVCRVFLAHPSAPSTGQRYAERAEVLRTLAEAMARESRPKIALGDFNATWASKDFREFCRVTAMLPASDYRPSWHAGLPRWLRIPIDHVLAEPRNFRVVSAASGVDGGGSDHLPVVAAISMRRPSLAVVRAD